MRIFHFLTGGGLLFWDRATSTSTLVRHTDILPEHSTMSLAALPGGRLLGGTTTAAGTGGAKKAGQAELYIMDMATKRVEWHEAVLPGAQAMGYAPYFLLTFFLAFPAYLLLPWVRRMLDAQAQREAET